MSSMEQRMASLEEEISNLHDSLHAKGVNSRRIASAIDGQVFQVPVDSEHKATQLPICKCANPHMRAFHGSWLGFFSTFLSTFAAAPLAGVLKQENTLGLTLDEIGTANIMSVAFTIIGRLMMGVVCDVVGARKGLAYLLLMTCPGIIGIMFVQEAVGFTVCRAIIGCSLASFVACQVWCTQQFSKNVVGTANATAGGWGNLGGGVANLLIPVVYQVFMGITGKNENLSWRLAFLVPLAFHLIGAAFVLTGRDLPDGNFKELELSGAKQKSSSSIVTKVGLSNVNAWLLTLSYGFCFGIELTMNNVASLFFQSYFALSVSVAGALASVFGMVNLFARSLGGITSDWAGNKWGMRGRIWQLWFWQTVQGVLCLVMGTITMGYDAPYPVQKNGDQTGWVNIGDIRPDRPSWLPFNSTDPDFDNSKYLIQHCGARTVIIDKAMRAKLDEAFSYPNAISEAVLSTPPAPFGAGDDCISQSGMLGMVVFVLFCFSISVQMAEGLTFGIVPHVSRPALGVVNGMVGAGGNAGSVLTLAIFFKGGDYRTDEAVYLMGITIIIVTACLFFVYFPEHGSMLCKAGSLKYDPQIIKPPKGYRGADSIVAVDPAAVQVAVKKEDAPQAAA